MTAVKFPQPYSVIPAHAPTPFTLSLSKGDLRPHISPPVLQFQ